MRGLRPSNLTLDDTDSEDDTEAVDNTLLGWRVLFFWALPLFFGFVWQDFGRDDLKFE